MNPERVFLHDLVGPLSTARNLIDIFILELENSQGSPVYIKKLEEIMSFLEKAAEVIVERREQLIKAEVKRENGG